MRAVFVIACLLVSLAGCAKKQVQTPAQPVRTNVVALLAEEDGSVGRIVVSNQAGSVELSEASTATRIQAIDVAPAAPSAADAGEIARLFGAALDGLPQPQAEFVLYFETGGDRLTTESEALLPQLLQAVQDRQASDVSITGHTDTTGDAGSNFTLGLRRAESVAEILVQRGLNRAYISVTSHGEGNLLIQTADGVAEPRNRRVEVIVR